MLDDLLAVFVDDLRQLTDTGSIRMSRQSSRLCRTPSWQSCSCHDSCTRRRDIPSNVCKPTGRDY